MPFYQDIQITDGFYISFYNDHGFMAALTQISSTITKEHISQIKDYLIKNNLNSLSIHRGIKCIDQSIFTKDIIDDLVNLINEIPLFSINLSMNKISDDFALEFFGKLTSSSIRHIYFDHNYITTKSFAKMVDLINSNENISLVNIMSDKFSNEEIIKTGFNKKSITSKTITSFNYKYSDSDNKPNYHLSAPTTEANKKFLLEAEKKFSDGQELNPPEIATLKAAHGIKSGWPIAGANIGQKFREKYCSTSDAELDENTVTSNIPNNTNISDNEFGQEPNNVLTLPSYVNSAEVETIGQEQDTSSSSWCIIS